MGKDRIGWKPVSELKVIDKNISSYGYTKKYIDSCERLKGKHPHCSSMINGTASYYELLEVDVIDGEACYRDSDCDCMFSESPERFKTQFGTFINHDNGEFTSWLGRGNLPGGFKKGRYPYPKEEFNIEGNYCDMFDCGPYSYAISNLLHLGLGEFKIVRIDKDLNTEVLFDNDVSDGWKHYEYLGRIKNPKGYYIIITGFYTKFSEDRENDKTEKQTIILQIDKEGGCSIFKKWDFSVSYSCSIALNGSKLYLGQNNMITELDIESGEYTYLTNRDEEILKEMVPMFD